MEERREISRGLTRPGLTRFRSRRSHLLMISAAAMPVVASVTAVLGDTITYTPPGATGQITAVTSGNVAGSALTAGAGITPTSTANSLSAVGFDGTTGSNAALNANNYFTFTAAPAANYSLAFTQLVATVSRDTATPAPDRAAWFYSVDSFGARLGAANTTVLTTPTSQNIPLTDTGITTATEFRLTAWNSGTGALATSFFAIGPTSPVTLTATSTLRAATTLTWDGGRGDGNWNTYLGTANNQSNWDNNNTPAVGLVDNLIFAGNSQRNTTNNIAGVVTVGSITFANTTVNAFTLSGNPIALNNGVTSNSAANHTINLDVTLGGASPWTTAGGGAIRMTGNVVNGANNIVVSGTGDVSFTGVIGGGSGGLQKDGTTTLTLTGNNTFTGGVAITGGTLSIKNLDSTPTDAQALGEATSTIALAGTSATTLLYTGAGNGTVNRGFTVGAAGATFRTTGGNVTLGAAGSTSGIATAGGAPLLFDAAAANITVSGAITGTGTAITKTGTGTLSLSSSGSTYDGAVVVSAGALSVSSINAVATSPQSLGTGTSALLIGSALSPGTFTYIGASNTSLARDVQVGGAGGAILQSTSGRLTFAGNILASGNPLTFGGADKIVVAGIISGSGTVTKTDNGTLTLTAANTFTGPIVVDDGKLSVSSIDPTPAVAQPLGVRNDAITVGSANGAVLEYTGGAVSLNRQITVGGAGGASIRATGGTLTLDTDGATSGVNGAGFDVTFDANGANIVVNSVISGTGTGVSKIGPDTLTLKGDNTFNGVVNVAEGMLTVNSLDAVATNPQPLGVGTSPIVVGGAAPATLNFSIGSSKTLSRGITIGGPGGGTIRASNASGVITLAQNISGGNPVTFEAIGTLNVTAAVTGASTSVSKTGTGLLTLAGTGSNYTGSTAVLAGMMVLNHSLTTSSQVTVENGALLKLAPSAGANVIHTHGVTINGNGKLDVGNGKLITTSAVGTSAGLVYDGVTGLIQSGRNGGGWGGGGVITSQTQATTSNLTSIGVASAAQVKGIAATATAVFAGETVTGSDTLVMYTYGGDANLDGKINVDDYTRIDFNVPLGTNGWYNGDFNYDGKINVDDYTIIDFNVGIQGAPFSSGADGFSRSAGLSGGLSAVAVPEPGMAGWLLMLASAVPLRRRRRGG